MFGLDFKGNKLVDIDVETLTVRHNVSAHRFEVSLGDDLGVAEYRKDGSTYVFTHTGVPHEYEGRGIAAKIVRAALEAVKAEGATMVPVCPYVKAYVRRHPEYESLIRQYDKPTDQD